MAEIYSIIITLDGLEKAYIKDSIPEVEYTELCSRLLNQYKSILRDDTVSREFEDLETFKKKWDVGQKTDEPKNSVALATISSFLLMVHLQIECPRAMERLRVNLPATVAEPSASHHASSNGVSQARSSATGSQILLATENFITFLDALRLNMRSKDALHPLLSEVIQTVNQVTTADFENRGKIISWLIRLNGMKATEELGEDEARQLIFDMEGAYAGFKATLN